MEGSPTIAETRSTAETLPLSVPVPLCRRIERDRADVRHRRLAYPPETAGGSILCPASLQAGKEQVTLHLMGYRKHTHNYPGIGSHEVKLLCGTQEQMEVF